MDEKSKYEGDYQAERESRYKNVETKIVYEHDELVVYYNRWSRANPDNRNWQWDEYCDVRDSMPIGTNTKIREELKKRVAFGLH